jgi:hypothetical protein
MTRNTNQVRPALRVAGRVAVAALCLAGTVAMAGCSSQEADSGPTPPVTLTDVPGEDGVKQVTLSDAAAERLAVRTESVTAVAAGAASGTTAAIPYDAVVYAEDGSTWTYVVAGQNSYVRKAISISSVAGSVANLASGPGVGTEVVVVGAPELLGAEAEISGEE